MKTGVALAAGVLAFGLMASTAQAGGGWHGGGGGHHQPYYHHSYGHSNDWAVVAGITGALFGVAAIADAVSAPRYYAAPAPVLYQAPPPVYYYPAPRVYYAPAPVYYGPPAYYVRPPY
ncbi:MAG: hypothetical protein HY899_11625 [Deltaproteobacteria bacterium]|nr:hypothetical protein [Deltaproteobacteria bacterium]